VWHQWYSWAGAFCACGALTNSIHRRSCYILGCSRLAVALRCTCFSFCGGAGSNGMIGKPLDENTRGSGNCRAIASSCRSRREWSAPRERTKSSHSAPRSQGFRIQITVTIRSCPLKIFESAADALQYLLIFVQTNGPEVVCQVVVRDVVVQHREVTFGAPAPAPRVTDKCTFG
jgi:hypothetical protein